MTSFTSSRTDLPRMIGQIAVGGDEESRLLAHQHSAPQNSFDLRLLASVIDHRLLRPEASHEEISHFCRKAVPLGVGAVSIHQAWVPLATGLLQGSGVKVGTVVGFPFGTAFTSANRVDAEASIRVGAEELDMGMKIGTLRSGNVETVESDIQGVADIA